MIINKVALKRQSTVLLLLVLIVFAGIFSYINLPLESFPDINLPYIFVNTPYEGVAPSDIESLITIPLERKLKSLSDVEEIRSSSVEGFSTVSIQFMPKVNIEDALQKVRDKVDQAKQDLPKDLQSDPTITEMNFSDFPVLRVVLSGPFSLQHLKTIADGLEDRIEGVPGVLDARLTGGLEREIHVEFDLDRVAAYNVPFSALIAAVQRSNVNMPGGSMDIGPIKYTVRIPEDFKDPAEIFSIVVFSRQGKPVYLRDLATIKDSYKDPKTRARLNGQQSVSLAVMKRTGENIMEVSKGVKAVIAEAEKTFPPGLNVHILSDMSDDVRLMVSDLENNILSGLCLVLVVIFIFIGGRSAIFVALAIPYSMFLTFILLTGFDYTLNMVVLFSLMLALGMLVDNGIVIVENIYRHMQQGATRQEAAETGTNQVAWPVIVSTVTTLGAFFPLLFFPGIMGEFMKYLPITLIMALSSSLLVALVINPVLSARYQTVKKSKMIDQKNELTEGEAEKKKEALLKRVYMVILRFALRPWIRILVVLISFVLLFVSIYAFGKFGQGVEFFPSVEAKRANIYITAPVGTNLDASDEIVKKIEKIVTGYDDVNYVISNIGSAGGNVFAGGGAGTHISRVVLDFKDFNEREGDTDVIIAEVREKLLANIDGAEIQVVAEENGPPTGSPVNLEISGPESKMLGELAGVIQKKIVGIKGLVDLKDDFSHGKPEIRIKIDKEKAALMGLDAYTIAYTIKAAINGVKVGNFRQGKEEYAIIAKLPEKDRQSIESLNRITISGPMGKAIPLTSVATTTLTSGLGAISRIDQKRTVTISGGVSGRRTSNDIIAEIDKILQKEIDFPVGYSYKFTGEQMEQDKTQAFLGKAFMASIFIIFLVLVTQFNSVVTPIIILTSVALSLIGVFFGLLVTGRPFSVTMTGVGIISLAGVVVNNAIVLIDYFNQLKARGIPSREALLRAGLVRFRPVMLTAITTILGLLPMAIGVSFNFRKFAWEVGGESSQMWSSMAVAVSFGLGIATLLTLIVVPVLCSLVDSASDFFDRKKKPEAV